LARFAWTEPPPAGRFKDATDTDVFRAFVPAVLIPTLKPGEVVVADNLSPHKHPETIGLIEHGGSQCSVPAAVFPRPEPDRKDVEQNQGGSALRQSSLASRLE